MVAGGGEFHICVVGGGRGDSDVDAGDWWDWWNCWGGGDCFSTSLGNVDEEEISENSKTLKN